eukprot:6461891-Amphidinium_carterae.1
MVRDSNRTRRTGRGGDGGNGDDDDDDDFMNDGNDGSRGNQPLGAWNAENDAWARNRPRSLAVSAASPGGGDDPGRDPSSILAKFDLFSESLMKNARDLLPNAVRDSSPPPRRPLFGFGGGGGGGGDEPEDDDPRRPFGSPEGRDSCRLFV